MANLSSCILTPYSENSTWKLAFELYAERYFQLGPRIVHPILELDGSQIIYSADNQTINPSVIEVVLKVVSWFLSLGLLPLMMAIVVYNARHSYTFFEFNSPAIESANPDPVSPPASISNKSPTDTLREQVRAQILATEYVWRTYHPDLATSPAKSNTILPGLDLGNVFSLFDFIGPVDKTVQDRSLTPQYRHIITLCPLSEMREALKSLSKESNDLVNALVIASLASRSIQWSNFGRSIEDLPAKEKSIAERQSKWDVFVHDCSVEFDSQELPTAAADPEIASSIAAKQEALGKIPFSERFEKAFAILDLAVFEGQKTLVHCSDGASRGATLVIAYLINRFDVSAAQATAFVRSQRPCINPGYANELKGYHIALRFERDPPGGFTVDILNARDALEPGEPSTDERADSLQYRADLEAGLAAAGNL